MFAHEAGFAGRDGGTGRLPPFRAPRRFLQQTDQSHSGRLPILQLGPVLARLDQEDARRRSGAGLRKGRQTGFLDRTSGNADEAAILNRSSTAVSTLFTFWPPGPEDRENRSSNLMFVER